MTPFEHATIIAQRHGLITETLLSKSRLSEVVAARKELIFVLHDNGMTASAIARFLNYSDHTPVLYFLKGRVSDTKIGE